MRLSTEQAEIIRQATHQHFGPASRLCLFGSRTEDNARGGDIDLLIETTTHLKSAFHESIALETELQVALGDQRIEILLLETGSQPSTNHQKTRVEL